MLMVHLNWWFTGTLEEREMRGPSIPNLHIFLILSGTKVLSVYVFTILKTDKDLASDGNLLHSFIPYSYLGKIFLLSLLSYLLNFS